MERKWELQAAVILLVQICPSHSINPEEYLKDVIRQESIHGFVRLTLVV
ncbi:MAG TPA: hypothetical protein PLO43_01990 [Chlamydiales bacterium]|nr:hypothetical protein [Chlamydiales bacterium]